MFFINVYVYRHVYYTFLSPEKFLTPIVCMSVLMFLGTDLSLIHLLLSYVCSYYDFCNLCMMFIVAYTTNITCRVVQEVDEVIGTKSCVTGFDLKQLIYTTQVHSYYYYYSAWLVTVASITKS